MDEDDNGKFRPERVKQMINFTRHNHRQCQWLVSTGHSHSLADQSDVLDLLLEPISETQNITVSSEIGKYHKYPTNLLCTDLSWLLSQHDSEDGESTFLH